ncbi:unnamed protein product, partial [Brassica oleracea]
SSRLSPLSGCSDVGSDAGGVLFLPPPWFCFRLLLFLSSFGRYTWSSDLLPASHHGEASPLVEFVSRLEVRNGGACLRQGVFSSRIWASLVSSLLIRSGGVGWWRVGFLLAWCLAAEAHLAVIQEVFGVFFTDACKEVRSSCVGRFFLVVARAILWFSEVEQGGFSVLLVVDWSRRQLALKLIIPALGS